MAIVNGESGFTQLAKLNVTEELYFRGAPYAADKVHIVRSPDDLAGELSSDVLYLVDGVIDFTGTGYNITVPSGGLSIEGFSFVTSGLVCSDDNYSLFSGANAGNLFFRRCYVTVSGASAKIFDITANTGDEAAEFDTINFNDCSSIGTINGYRQVLESNTGRFGGSPSLEFKGSMNGYRSTLIIARNLDNGTTIFKAGAGLTFSGRFITNINCDLAATGALLDFAESNITNNESLIVSGAYVTRQGVIDTSDTTTHPNIDETSSKSYWTSNTGIPNTKKYIESHITSEATTTVSAANTYYPLLGTFTVGSASHFDSPVNGQYRLLSGNGTYQISGNFVLASTANNEVDLRVTKSTDGGSTFPTVVNHIKRTVNNLSGGRDVAFMPVDFIASLVEGDRIRIEVENKTAANDITAELDSFIIVNQI